MRYMSFGNGKKFKDLKKKLLGIIILIITDAREYASEN